MFGGGTVTFKTTVQCQTHELDQKSRPPWTPMEETKQPNLCMEDTLNVRPDQGQHEYRQLDVASAMTRTPSDDGGGNTGDSLTSCQGGLPCQTECEINICRRSQLGRKDKEGRSVSPAVDISSQQAATKQLKCLEIGRSTLKGTPCSEIQAQAVKPDVTPTEANTWCIARLGEEHSKIKSQVREAETEIWDECLFLTDDMQAGASMSQKRVSFLPSSTSLSLVSEPRTQQATEEVRRPLLGFPTRSYYPLPEPTTQFEEIWRVWESLDEDVTPVKPMGTPCSSTKTSMDFTVMSYNILAQDLLEINQELYTHCPLEVLDWKYRCRLILEEITKWRPDILCLQEVQEDHYNEQLHPALTQMGYSCIYKRRTGTKTDGCATCYQSSQFTEVTVTPLEFFRPETALLDRHNVGIVLLLRPVARRASPGKECGPPLCVANTHLLFNPRRGDVKLAQLAIMLAEMDRVMKACRAKGEECNVILCGDLNSVPNMPLYQLITTGGLHYHGLPSWMVSGQEDLSYRTHCYRLCAPLWPGSLGITDCCQYTSSQEDQESPKSGKYQYSRDVMLKRRFSPAACVRPRDLPLIPGVTDNTPDDSRRSLSNSESFRQSLCQRLDLKSVYKHLLPGSGKPEVTTLNSDVGATVDYIFYSPKRSSGSHLKDGGESSGKGLKLTGCLSLPSEEILWFMNGLPNHTCPSDHLSLLAKFQVEFSG